MKHLNLDGLGFSFSFAVEQIMVFRIDAGRDRTMHKYGPLLRWFTGQTETLVEAGVPPEVVVWVRGREAPYRLRCTQGTYEERLSDAATVYAALKKAVGGWSVAPPETARSAPHCPQP